MIKPYVGLADLHTLLTGERSGRIRELSCTLYISFGLSAGVYLLCRCLVWDSYLFSLYWLLTQGKPTQNEETGNHPPTNHTDPPIQPAKKIPVKIPAPARSPVVIGFSGGGLSLPLPLPLLLPVPAFGSPLLVPPVVEVLGPACLAPLNKLAERTLRALVCCSSPELPSHLFPYHRCPQSLPSLPPEHVVAAACAELFSLAVIWFASSAEIEAVRASELARMPLKQAEFPSHPSLGSHC